MDPACNDLFIQQILKAYFFRVFLCQLLVEIQLNSTYDIIVIMGDNEQKRVLKTMRTGTKFNER